MITIQAGYALVIDDEPANRDFLVRLLQTANFKVIGAGTGAEGLKAAQSIPELALALVDQELPDSSGLEVIAQLRATSPETLLVMATMHDDRTLINKAFEAHGLAKHDTRCDASSPSAKPRRRGGNGSVRRTAVGRCTGTSQPSRSASRL